MFYNRFGINNLLSVRQVGDASRLQYLLTDASILDFYPNVPSTSLLEQFALPSINRLIDSDIHTPLDTLFNVNISKKLPSDFSLTLTYSHAKGFRQSLTRNVNAPLAGTFDLQNPVAIYPLGRAEGQTYRTFSGGKRESDWINLNLGIPSLKYLETQFSYSFFKGKNDLVAGSGSPFDAYDFSREFSRAENDGQHRISISTVSNKLPFGISIVNFFNFATGSRFNIITGRDTNGDGFYSERPAFATDLSKPNLIVTKYGILDPNPSPTDTIIPRNLGRGPATFNLDTIFDKNFKLGVDKNNPKKGGYNLNLSVYIRNALNTNNKGNPIGNISSPNFLRQIGYSSDASYVFANSAGTFSGFSGRSFNFSIGFGF